MTRSISACLGTGLLLFVSGCAICASPYDSHYPAYGGSWERADPAEGRVASILHPAGAMHQAPVDPESKGWTPESNGAGSRSILSPSSPARGPSQEDAPPDLELMLPE
jgi:hypothetical protein